MKERRLTWKALAPEGISAKKETAYTAAALVVSSVWSLTAIYRMAREWKQVAPGAAAGRVMALVGFGGILGTSLFGFYLTAMAMVGIAIWHYTNHRRDGKADYNMRRVPNKWDLHRRCLAIPTAGIILSMLLSIIFYIAYRSAFVEYRGRLMELFNEAWVS